MQSKLQQAFSAPVTIILLGVTAITAFMLGRLTALVTTANHLQATTTESINLPGKSPSKSRLDPSSEGDDEDAEDERDLQDFSAFGEECKLVLVVRTDLGMTKGKIAAQCSHATLACYKALQRQDAKSKHPLTMLKRWEHFGQAKVTVQVKSEEELLTLQAQAMSLGLCAKIIHDAGRTQIASGSATVLGVGPGPRTVVDQVTGGLKLL